MQLFDETDQLIRFIALWSLVLLGLSGVLCVVLGYQVIASDADAAVLVAPGALIVTCSIVLAMVIWAKRKDQQRDTCRLSQLRADFPGLVRTDEKAIRLVQEYRARFRDGPIGQWTTCNDHFMGTGFEGTVGLWSEMEFRSDHTGYIRSHSSEPSLWRFKWRTVGEREIEITTVDHRADYGEVESPGSIDHAKYDFFVPRGTCDVYLYDPTTTPNLNDRFLASFLTSHGPLKEYRQMPANNG